MSGVCGTEMMEITKKLRMLRRGDIQQLRRLGVGESVTYFDVVLGEYLVENLRTVAKGIEESVYGMYLCRWASYDVIEAIMVLPMRQIIYPSPNDAVRVKRIKCDGGQATDDTGGDATDDTGNESENDSADDSENNEILFLRATKEKSCDIDGKNFQKLLEDVGCWEKRSKIKYVFLTDPENGKYFTDKQKITGEGFEDLFETVNQFVLEMEVPANHLVFDMERVRETFEMLRKDKLKNQKI